MIKKEIENYINKNYNKLLNAANSITHDETAGDLLNDVLYDILTRNKYSNLLKSCKPDFFGYIFKSMIVQYNSKNTLYYKQFRTYKPILDEYIVFFTFIEEKKDNEIDKIIEFVKDVDLYEEETKNKNNKVKNKYKIKNKLDKELFFMYFFPERYNDITYLSLKEVNDIRKTSYRKITKKINISYSTVSISVNKVLNKINENLDEIC